MDATVTYKCPNCDAGLIFDAEKQKFVCEFCISSFSEDELNSTEAAERAEQSERDNAEFSSSVDEYFCPSCGAEVIADKSTVADTCYYCHNPIVLSDKISGAMKPEKIVPFTLNKDSAIEEFHRFAKKKIFVPKDYFATAQMEKMSGVYYPFWVTDADTEASMSAVGKEIRTWREGDYRCTETTIYDVERAGRIHFEDITTAAISTEDKAMLEGILPYPTDAYKDFSMPYLQGFVAKKRDLSRENITGEVRSRMGDYAEQLFRGTARQYDTLNVKSSSQNVLSSHWLYALMPVWILTYKKKGRTEKSDKTFVYAMNGNTGKLYGELPISAIKLAALCVAVFAAALLVFGAIAVSYFGDMTVSMIWAGIFAAVATTVTAVLIVRRYKRKLQAPIYPLEHYANLSLHHSKDRFVDRIVTRVRVSSNKRK